MIGLPLDVRSMVLDETATLVRETSAEAGQLPYRPEGCRIMSP
jgi:hypothetical protein